MRTYLITGPASEPLTLAEAKLHCRVDTGDNARDDLITAAIIAARERAEHVTGRRLISQVWEGTMDSFPDAIVLDSPPFISVTHIKYREAVAGVETTLNSASYAADLKGLRAYIVPAYGYTWPDTWPEINSVTVRWVAGYADAAAVPQSVKQYMRLSVADMLEHAKASTVGKLEPNPIFDRLLDALCVQLIA